MITSTFGGPVVSPACSCAATTLTPLNKRKIPTHNPVSFFIDPASLRLLKKLLSTALDL
jgi:hypothetical protein